MNYIVDKKGTKRWRNDKGEYHREDGPAIEMATGSKFWYVDGLFHREDGPAVEDLTNRLWYIRGKLHREDGPAIESSSFRKWYINNMLHRVDGPAIEYINGDTEWYINGEPIDCKDNDKFLRIVKMKSLL
jgi:hypothetical protein